VKKLSIPGGMLLTGVIALLGACGDDQAIDLVGDTSIDYEIVSQANDFANRSFERTQYSVIVNGVSLTDTYPRKVNEWIYIPLAPVSLALGAVFEWNPDTLEVMLDGFNGRIVFTAGSEDFLLDDEIITMPNKPPVLIDNRIHVPIQFFEDIFGVANIYFENDRIIIY